MILWFAGVSFVIVWSVFRGPALDYRLVMLGAVLPRERGPRWGPVDPPHAPHVCRRPRDRDAGHHERRLLRRRLIGVPIGMMLHLALDGTFTRSDLFWWPFLGGEALGVAGLPEFDRAIAVTIVLDMIGAACLVWAYRRFGLDDPGRRAEFLHTGHLDRSLAREA